ncbi:MAG: acylphosphatase [Thermoprotei archaeon]|nr:MAG: acylphosphatase [Thermoprotei archaeon]
MANVRAHIFVSGIVQGVFFRATMREVARKYGVTGWVRNLPDGRVEAVLEGPEEAVKKVIEWAHRGPPLARVEKVEVKWEEYKGEFKDFNIRW